MWWHVAIDYPPAQVADCCTDNLAYSLQVCHNLAQAASPVTEASHKSHWLAKQDNLVVVVVANTPASVVVLAMVDLDMTLATHLQMVHEANHWCSDLALDQDRVPTKQLVEAQDIHLVEHLKENTPLLMA